MNTDPLPVKPAIVDFADSRCGFIPDVNVDDGKDEHGWPIWRDRCEQHGNRLLWDGHGLYRCCDDHKAWAAEQGLKSGLFAMTDSVDA